MTTTTSTRNDNNEIYRSEREKWDALAERKRSSLTPTPLGANFHTSARESAVMPGMAEFLGDLSDRRVLEYGCGLGELTVLLARSGASVTSFDISEASVAVAQRRAEINGLAERISLSVAAGGSCGRAARRRSASPWA
jgi:2-polyprenyl-3-methyl-5-hydroxy-6-metoxy-1,4-benzoquinol methylase